MLNITVTLHNYLQNICHPYKIGLPSFNKCILFSLQARNIHWYGYDYMSASGKRAFLLYYAVPLLSSYLPPDHLFFLMMLAGGLFRLLKQSISRTELQEACIYLKLFTAQAPIFYGRCMYIHVYFHAV